MSEKTRIIVVKTFACTVASNFLRSTCNDVALFLYTRIWLTSSFPVCLTPGETDQRLSFPSSTHRDELDTTTTSLFRRAVRARSVQLRQSMRLKVLAMWCDDLHANRLTLRARREKINSGGHPNPQPSFQSAISTSALSLQHGFATFLQHQEPLDTKSPRSHILHMPSLRPSLETMACTFLK